MIEKITRAQAEAMVDRMSDWVPRHTTPDGDWDAATLEGLEALNILRAYLAQQPSDDVVRKAHPALTRLRNDGVDCDCEFGPREDPGVEDDYASVLAALPPMPEEK